jgi:hypothetical protein
MPRNSKRRSWSASDIRTLKTLSRKKTRAGSIARTLKRTEGATRQKAFSLGLSLDSRWGPAHRASEKPRPWRGFFDGPGMCCVPSLTRNHALVDCLLGERQNARRKVHDAATALPRIKCWTANVIIVHFRMRILKDHACARCSMHCKN